MTRTRPLALVLLLLAACSAPADDSNGDMLPVVEVAPDAPLGAVLEGPPAAPSHLQTTLASIVEPATVVLRPGRYNLQAEAFTDSTCGNCQELETPVPGTRGLHVTVPGVRIVGPGADSAFIHTNAGYGLYFDGCDGCALEGVTVTGGVRDPDGRAADGGVVVKNGRVELTDCVVRDNIGDSATVAETVVGIAGVVGREGSEIVVDGCRVIRNSWDGFALYRQASAEITNTVVDGVDAARGGQVGGGRGVGIGATWDASVMVRNTLVRNYWKGIGGFVDARVDARCNIVEEILTWGLAFWGADGGAPAAVFRENVVYETGACGAMIARETEVAEGEDPGELVGNVFVATGQDPRYDSGTPYCHQRAIARHAVPPGFEIERNLVHDAREPGDEWPTSEPVDREAVRSLGWIQELARMPVFSGSSFLTELGR
ncbi:MAG: right-handed parallel beta-helix repeat-containing protein [Longimicrobiales bacterium]